MGKVFYRSSSLDNGLQRRQSEYLCPRLLEILIAFEIASWRLSEYQNSPDLFCFLLDGLTATELSGLQCLHVIL